jgi:hypothetical protein
MPAIDSPEEKSGSSERIERGATVALVWRHIGRLERWNSPSRRT